MITIMTDLAELRIYIPTAIEGGSTTEPVRYILTQEENPG